MVNINVMFQLPVFVIVAFAVSFRYSAFAINDFISLSILYLFNQYMMIYAMKYQCKVSRGWLSDPTAPITGKIIGNLC
jgi:hypothetical protein